jgi:hypothetical protein
MATPNTDTEEKKNPIDQYTQQENGYRQDAANYREQLTAIDNQMQQMPDFDYNNFYNEWKTGKKPLVDILTSNYRKPEKEIDPEQAKKAKFGAALTDSLSSIAEIVANGKGSLVRNRGNEPTSTQTTNERLQKLQDKYDNEMLNYNAAKGNGEMQDFNQQLQSAMNARGQKRQYLLYKSKELQDNAKEAQKQADEQQKNAADYQLKLEEQGFKGKELSEKMRQFNLGYGIDKQKLGIEQYNAKTSRIGKEQDEKSKGFNAGKAFVKPQDVNQIAAEIIKNEKPTVIVMKQDARGNMSPIKVPIDVNSSIETKKALIAKYPNYAETHYGMNTSQQVTAPVRTSAPAVNWKMPIGKNITTQAKVKSIYD